MTSDSARYRSLAEAAWRWVLDQVDRTDGPRIPASVDVDSGTVRAVDDAYRDGLHEGIAGLAHVLEEIRVSRPWTAEEADLAAAVADRLRAQVPATTDASFFDGLAATIGALLALREGGVDETVRRMRDTWSPDGWPPAVPPTPTSYLSGARYNDATVGTASAVLAAVWAMRNAVPCAADLAERSAAVLVTEAEETPAGLNWQYVPRRFWPAPRSEMPNWSHGLAGVAAALALAGVELDRSDLVDAARRGAEHLVTLADLNGDGFIVPLAIPRPDPAKADPFSLGWCHGPTGSSLLFVALERAGVEEVAGRPTMSWYARCRHSVRTSGLPDRLRPGFWDNDGRCCGTTGVGDAFLDAYVRAGDGADLAFAVRLGEALVERAVVTDTHAYWRFVEHRQAEPLLPPGVGWMQGAAGIAAYLFRLARVVELGRDAPAVPRMENWWAVERP
jgi:hypothetical protein